MGIRGVVFGETDMERETIWGRNCRGYAVRTELFVGGRG